MGKKSRLKKQRKAFKACVELTLPRLRYAQVVGFSRLAQSEVVSILRQLNVLYSPSSCIHGVRLSRFWLS